MNQFGVVPVMIEFEDATAVWTGRGMIVRVGVFMLMGIASGGSVCCGRCRVRWLRLWPTTRRAAHDKQICAGG
jgi:hypothetical protein